MSLMAHGGHGARMVAPQVAHRAQAVEATRTDQGMGVREGSVNVPQPGMDNEWVGSPDSSQRTE